MTEEQLKQNAEEYYQKLDSITIEDPREPNVNSIIDAYTAGAHSRDEEIVGYQMQINMTADALQQCMDELKQLRNPWISVKERLPENNCVVFVSLDGTEYLSAHYRAKSKRFVTVSKDKQTLIEVRKSRATYATCGDCIKEEQLYSEGQREDITSLVTHWMPANILKV